MHPEPLHLQLSKCLIRNWMSGDEPSLVRHADNYNVWLNLRDVFPHPYTMADARHWVSLASTQLTEHAFAIDVGGFAVGGVGLRPDEDVNRISAEVGYWLGEEYWGQGIITEAVTAMTRHAFDKMGFGRVYAHIFDYNTASIRVLEKAGYALEGRMRGSAIKDGRVVDQLLYACVLD